MPSTTPDQGTILLYALSTLAQTCAALAALVGAVGIFRLQILRAGQTTAERNLRGLAGQANLLSGDIAPLLPIKEIIMLVANVNPMQGPDTVAAQEALAPFRTFPSTIRRSRKGLIVFEVWNLIVIGASLVGFNYVPLLVSSPWTFWALWAAAVGTVLVTAYSVFAWTRG